MKIMGIPVRVHPLMPFVLVAAMLLGAGADLGIALSSLCLHELSHAMMALMLHVRVQEIEFMPLGGAARVEDVWQLRPMQLLLIALAGPLMNLLLLMLAAALAWAQWMGPYTALIWIRINLVMMLFNLMPALPLDGGRLLAALLAKALPAERAIRVGVVCGRVFSACLLAYVLGMWLLYGELNLTFVCCAFFLWVSAGRELALSRGGVVLSLVRRREELADESVMPVRWLAAFATQDARDVLRRMQSRQLHRIAVYDHSMGLLGTLEESDLIECAMNDERATLAALLRKRHHNQIAT